MKQYHPIIQFLYFTIIIGFSMFIMHPMCLLISFLCAFSYAIHVFQLRTAWKGLLGLTGIMLVTAIMNPAFSHQGVTFLAYLPTGNILTLESIFYGIAAAFMLGAVLLWFRCMNEIITSDKIIYLFGKTFPILGLLLSMILGFIPKLQRKMRQINMARKQDKRNGVLRGIDNLSILVTWCLEDAVEVADSMKARGYGLEGRTSFTIYRFTKRDAYVLCLLLLASGYVMIGILCGGLIWDYYPSTEGATFAPYTISLYIVYLLLGVLPILVDRYEERKWNSLQLKI